MTDFDLLEAHDVCKACQMIHRGLVLRTHWADQLAIVRLATSKLSVKVERCFALDALSGCTVGMYHRDVLSGFYDFIWCRGHGTRTIAFASFGYDTNS